MNSRTLILMVVAVAIAITTVIVVKGHSGSEESGLKILVAANDIATGSFVHADKDIAWVDWPQSNMTAAYITPDAHHIEEFNGAVARHAIGAGEPINASSLMRPSDGGFMAAVLAPGMRAVSIAVSLTTGNAGFVFPGDKVDLLLTHKIPVKDSNDNVLASETFIEDVRVLAVDQMLDNPENKAVVAKTITLEVTPKQAEMVNVATSLGSISVSLRSLASVKPGDKTPAVMTPLTGTIAHVPSGGNYSTDNDVSKLMGDKNSVHAKVSVYHGGSSEQIDFHQGGR